MPINRVTIVGNLTRDPELRALPSGGNVCSLRVAVNERRKDASGQWSDAPNFFNVTIFGNSADNAAKFLSKGRQVAVDGRLRWREWQDQQGNKREAIEIVAQDVQFIGGRDGGGGQGGGGGGWGPPAQQSGGQGGQPANDDWGGGGGQQGGGFSGPGTAYPVEQGDFGGPGQSGFPQQPQQPQYSQQPPQQQPSSAPVADDDIPF